MSSQDPLIVLRRALTSNQPISLLSSSGAEVFDLRSAESISLGSVTLPKNTPTRFLRNANADPTDPAAEAFDLQTLLFGYNERDTNVAQYLRKANELGVGLISSLDRKVVLDYLSGSGSEEGPEGRVRPLPGSAKRAAEDEAADASAGAAPGTAGGAPPTKKQRYVPDKDDQEKVKKMALIVEGAPYGFVVGPNEKKYEKSGAVYHNRETVLRGERINNFESVISLVAPRLKQMKEDQQRKQPSSAQTATPAAPAARPQKKKQLNPIIMISPSSTALITMHNVKQFLEEARFIPSDEARRLASGGNVSGYIAEDVVQVNHARASASSGSASGANTAATRHARYFVVDSVEALSKFGGAGKLDEAWDRVVCVMTTGQEWQFKPYKWKEPKELFHHVKGIYPQWTTDPMNPKIKNWNVSELRIDPHRRHIDKSVVADFWRSLETWIQANKPWLSF